MLIKRMLKLNRKQQIFIKKQCGLKCESIFRTMLASAISMKKGKDTCKIYKKKKSNSYYLFIINTVMQSQVWAVKNYKYFGGSLRWANLISPKYCHI